MTEENARGDGKEDDEKESPLSFFPSPLALPLTAHLPLIVNSRNTTGEDGKPCLTSVAIILFEKAFRQISPSF